MRTKPSEEVKARVAFVSGLASRNNGGLTPAMRPLARGLVEQGWRLRMFSAKDDRLEAERGKWEPVEVRARELRFPRRFWYAPGLRDDLAEYAPAIVHSHGLWTYASYAAHRTVSRSGCLSVVSPHGMLDRWALARSRSWKWIASSVFERAHLKRAAVIHALTEGEAVSIRQLGLKQPIAVIPNGIDLPIIPPGSRPVPDELAATAGRRIVLFLGRVSPQKGVLELIEAWGSLPRERGDEWVLVVAGPCESDFKRSVLAAIERLDLVGRVILTGAVYDAQKERTLRAADAFVLPSQSEGMPMAVLEAWAWGKPVIMSEACNLREGIAARAALCACPGPQGIARALEELFQMPEGERRAIGERGRALVERTFNWKGVSERHSECYAWLLGWSERPGFVRI